MLKYFTGISANICEAQLLIFKWFYILEWAYTFCVPEGIVILFVYRIISSNTTKSSLFMHEV